MMRVVTEGGHAAVTERASRSHLILRSGTPLPRQGQGRRRQASHDPWDVFDYGMGGGGQVRLLQGVLGGPAAGEAGTVEEEQCRGKRPSLTCFNPLLLSHVACLSQEMTIKHEEKKAKREARQAVKAAKRESENAGRGQATLATHGRPCAAVMPCGSSAPMQPMQSPLPPIAVMLAPM